jgi:hypothetical protein
VATTGLVSETPHCALETRCQLQCSAGNHLRGCTASLVVSILLPPSRTPPRRHQRSSKHASPKGLGAVRAVLCGQFPMSDRQPFAGPIAMHATLPKTYAGTPQHGPRRAPARPAGRKLLAGCQAATGNGNGNGNGNGSGAAGVEAERARFAAEQSNTAKIDQASILRKRAAEALSAQRRLMEARSSPRVLAVPTQRSAAGVSPTASCTRCGAGVLGWKRLLSVNLSAPR